MGNAPTYHYSKPWSKIQSLAAAILGGAATAAAAPATNTWSFSASLAAKETFDDNVYLQSMGSQEGKSSLVTTISPQVGVTWKPADAFDAALGYNAGINFFHNESSQDYVVHRGSLNWNGQVGETRVESVNSLVGIDGSEVGPTWKVPGGAPAAGGPAIRDRHDALILRDSLRLIQSLGEWRLRPAATFYLHDWGTQERQPSTGYQNYVDRDEWTAGIDAGRTLKPDLTAFAGYRFGAQDEARLLQFPEQYDSHFHRVLFAVEGKLAPCLKANVTLGPEFRQYEETVPASFDRSRVNLFVDAALTLTPTRCDSLTLSAKQFQQPGFSGRSAYTDLTYDFDWRHSLGAKWSIGIATRAYNTHFLRPVKRNDWVLTPAAIVNYAVSSCLNLEASAGYETGFTETANAEGRDYERTFVSLGARYTWP